MAETASPPRFVHLHLHSQYSLLDGGNRLDKLIARVKALGMDAVAVTDHGNLHGAVDFYTRATEAGVKPILGIEAYVAADIDGRPSDRTSREHTGSIDGGFHLVLLAEDQTGWANLLKLSSDSWIEGFYYKPRMDKGTLGQWHEGLIAINGHLGSSVAYHLVKYEQTGDPTHYKRARAEAEWHRDLFGTNAGGEPRFYLELQHHEEQLQRQINRHTIRLARELEVPLVADNDAHFLTADAWDIHDTMCCINMQKLKAEEQRIRYPRDLYVKSPQEMVPPFVDELGVPEAIDNTAKIADRCNVDLDFTTNHAPVVGVKRIDDGRLPSVDSGSDQSTTDSRQAQIGSTPWYKRVCATFEVVPVGGEFDEAELKRQCDDALRDLCEAGLLWRYGEGGVTEDIRARLDRELKILSDKDISPYFLIVWDFVNEARRRGIPANARGSGVGTMVGYVLGLSNACPVKYGLLFERFTDPDRSEYPDIDIDLCQDGRGEIIEFVRQKYGHVAQIVTFNVLKARASIRDVGRVLNVSLQDVDKVCKLIGDGLKTTLESAWETEPDLKKLCDESPQLRQMYDTARQLEGMPRHVGVHAAGVIVATQPLDNIVPLCRPPKNNGNGSEGAITQWDGPTCEKLGLLKMDFLGLRTLSIVERAKALIRETLSEAQIAAAVGRDDARGPRSPGFDPLDLERLTYDDPNVLGLFSRGETAGVFQFESDGMRHLLMGMQPDRLEDLIAANALYRPGPMDLIPNYCNRKHGREQVPPQHEIVSKFTDETYGIMVYQEQVMQIVHELGGIPLRQAYTLIKAISKKKHKVIDANRAQFLKGAADKGLPEPKAAELFDLILKFAGYGFNKSHSTGYAIVAYQTAYLKTYFPLHYMAAVLTYESGSTDKVAQYMDECRKVRVPKKDGKGYTTGIEVKPPDINRSGFDFTVVYSEEDRPEDRTAGDGHIRFGLGAVKGVGEKAINAVIAARTEDGKPKPFRGLYDFCERVPLQHVNRATIEALIKCGAFDDLHGRDARSALVEALDPAMRAGQRAAAERISGQISMFGSAEPASAGGSDAEAASPEPPFPNVPAWTKKQTLDHEKEALGLYVSSHPLKEHAGRIRRYSSCPLADALKLSEGTEVVLGGMLSRVRPTIVKKGRSAGQKMAHLTLEDDAANKVDATVFSDTYATCYAALQTDAVVFLVGKIDCRREEPCVIVDRVVPVEDAEAKLTRAMKIVIREQGGEGRNGEGAQQMNRLREVLRQAGSRANGSAADVLLELHQQQTVARFRLGGMRVAVDPELTDAITTILGNLRDRTGGCELIGPPKVRPPKRRDPTAHASLRFSARDDSGQSIDRY